MFCCCCCCCIQICAKEKQQQKHVRIELNMQKNKETIDTINTDDEIGK